MSPSNGTFVLKASAQREGDSRHEAAFKTPILLARGLRRPEAVRFRGARRELHVLPRRAITSPPALLPQQEVVGWLLTDASLP